MEKEKFYNFELLHNDIGTETMSEFKRVSKNIQIKKGMENTIKKIGRPTKISTEQLKKVYQIWKTGEATQREIAKALNVSERTLNRKFKQLKGEENEIDY